MSEVRVKAIRPLPEPLPDGERILWQFSPAWRPYARRVFQLNKIAFYFALLLLWVSVSAVADSGRWSAVLGALSWSAPPALVVLAGLALIGWLYARSTTYTITTKRVVIQSGVAVPAAINLPFSRIESADLKIHSDGTGDIELSLSGERVLYSMLWPNVRMLRLKHPRPMLRALESPEHVADVLGRALTEDQAPESTAPNLARGQDESRRSPVTA